MHLFSDISGGQLNPAVSFGLFFARKLSLVRAAILSVAQIIGGLIAAGMFLDLTLEVVKRAEGDEAILV